MKKIIIASVLLMLGFGCNQVPVEKVGVQTPPDNKPAEVVTTTSMATTTTETKTSGKLTVARSFTIEEIESEGGGGVKEWFRQLARANVAGKKTLVSIPVNHIQGFGCLVPTEYCASTITGGCYGPYLDLKGNKTAVANAPGTVWAVEGYVVAASKVPDYPEDDARSCAEGELIYDFQVTKVLNKLELDSSEEFRFVEYK